MNKTEKEEEKKLKICLIFYFITVFIIGIFGAMLIKLLGLM